MNLASISENQDIEKRIAITPEIAKKYISLGFNLALPNNYGTYLGFTDEEYKNLGLQNPSVKEPIQSLYHEAKRRCSKLLGKVKATESLITELRSN